MKEAKNSKSRISNSFSVKLKKYSFLLAKIGVPIALLFMVGMYYFSVSYPKITNYYLEDNIAFSFQFHSDVWDNEEDTSISLLQYTHTNIHDALRSYVMNDSNNKLWKENTGLLLVSEENALIPIYFFEAKREIPNLSSNYYMKYVEPWYVFSLDEGALNKVKFYGQSSNNSNKQINKKWYEHPNISVTAHWDLLQSNEKFLSTFSSYLPFDPTDEFFTSINTYAAELIPETILWGDIQNNKITLAGYSTTGASHVLPLTDTSKKTYHVPILENALSISIDEPLKRITMFKDNANQIHHIFALTLANYLDLEEFYTLFVENPIRRISFSFISPIDFPVIHIWLDKGYSYKTLLNYLVGAQVEIREYNLPDGTKAKELIRSNKELDEGENGTFVFDDQVFYVNLKEDSDNTLVTLTKIPIAELEMNEKEIGNEDLLSIPINITPEKQITVTAISKTNFTNIEHKIEITL